MDEISAGLCHELFKIARGAPELGVGCEARINEICRKLRSRIKDPEQENALQATQALLKDWAAENGWQRYGNSPEVLRGENFQNLGALAVSSCFSEQQVPRH